MRDEFDFENIRSTEFCVSATEGDEHANYLVPTDRHVQGALRDMLNATVQQFENVDDGAQPFELSEKYAPREALVGDLASDEMQAIHSLYDEEGWVPNPAILRHPANVAYYFAVFRDQRRRKLLGVRRAAQFKGVLKSHLITLADDSLTLVGDNIFKLDHEFDFLITSAHVYILHPTGFERIADIEQLVSAKAREKALALGTRLKFANFERIAAFVERHKRAARLVAALSARGGLEQVRRGKFVVAARETEVELEDVGRRIGPAAGSEMAFLELLDQRRYTTSLSTGPKDAFVAGSRRPVPRR